MRKNRILSLQKIAARHKFDVALFVLGALCLTVADRSMGACDTPINSQTPIPELNGVYTPDMNYPAGICPKGYTDVPCDPLSNYPCQGGLYLDKATGNASNQQPSGHLTDGLVFASGIAPIPPRGGKIVLLSMGMCNAWLKFGNDPNSFISKLCNSGAALFCAPGATGRDNSLNPNLEIVNGAQPEADAKEWAKDPDDPTQNPWAWTHLLNTILPNATVDPSQVEVIWCEHALLFDNNPNHTLLCTAFPDHALTLKDNIEQTLRNIHAKFPNCKIVYISSRAYAYSLDYHNPEPKAYQTGFADKWVILDQLNGLGNIGYKGHNRTSPWIAWGPYLWTNGGTPRSDGLIWRCNQNNANLSDVDTHNDYVHPSTNGVNKVAEQLIAFFKTDPTATPWFLRQNDANANISATIPELPETVSTTADVTLTGTASSVGHTIVSYQWTFDDGESAFVQNPPTRKFNIPGQYNIHLTAIDDVGNHASTSGVLTVTQ